MEIHATEVYTRWYYQLRDRAAQTRISNRVRRLAQGNPGDAAPAGGGVLELRIDYGPGYQVYYTQRGRRIVALLAGGDKSTQQRDIATAQRLARDL